MEVVPLCVVCRLDSAMVIVNCGFCDFLWRKIKWLFGGINLGKEGENGGNKEEEFGEHGKSAHSFSLQNWIHSLATSTIGVAAAAVLAKILLPVCLGHDKHQRLQIEQQASQILLSFPQHMEDITGKITLYRPSNARLDQKLEISLDEAKKQSIATSDLEGGKWLIRIDWSDGSKDYFDEKVMVL